ncbi:diacylglycerol/lipid kinase family protein [uncultured Amnibacterium sp.]|uniref:diacylglycerol/lipid kinase family protein n=1 Tax=uncultured Amnibacterium sp. TaxID=1631851 RepID=UPI0035CB3702
MHVVVAVNPHAASGRRAAVAARTTLRLQAAGHRVTGLASPTAAALTAELQRAVTSGDVDAVIAVGGDGMVHLAVNVLAESGVPLGIVPTGSGNDIARALGLLAKGDVVDARLVQALTRPPRLLDAVRLDNLPLAGGGEEHRWFAGVLSAGFDAAVNERGNALTRLPGTARYAAAVLLEVAHLHPWRYRLTLDGVSTDLDAVLVTVGNTTSIGGGMRLTPDARPDDGLLDVLVASPLGRLNLLRLFPRVFTGTHTGDRHVTISRARTVTISAAPRPRRALDEPALDDRAGGDPIVYADGERIGPLPVTLECVPGALRLLG